MFARQDNIKILGFKILLNLCYILIY